ncbi:hypothetical protein BAR24066_07266 [Burkholderia arboris]|uniref:Uncharacterized protein n=1 Tax=Burkholderia arboris TaxID=488730 RepID=A0A9Q9SRG3_9BURK|nr:hypothetical protein BAR24066_07266 [Burkholderia arboris]
MLLGEEPAQLRVLDHEAHALGGIVWVDGDVSAAGLEDREERDDHVERALHGDADEGVGPDAERDEPVREAVGAQVEFGVGERGVVIDGGDGIGRARDLLFEQAVQRLRGGLAELRLGPVPLDGQQVPLGFARQRQPGNDGRRIVRETREQGPVDREETLHGALVEQIGVVVAIDQECLPRVEDVDVQIERGVADQRGDQADRQARQAGQRRHGLQIEDRRYQRGGVEIALRADFADQLGERIVLVLERVEQVLPGAGQEAGHGGLLGQRGAQRQQMRAVAGEAIAAGHGTAGHRDAGDNLLLAGDAVQEQVEAGKQHHVERAAVLTGGGAQRRGRRRVQMQRHALAVKRLHRGPWVVGRKVQRFGLALALREPVRAIRLRFRAVALGVELLQVFAKLERRRSRRGAGIRAGQILEQDAERRAVTDDVMGRHHQQVTFAVDAHERGAKERAVHQIERLAAFLVPPRVLVRVDQRNPQRQRRMHDLARPVRRHRRAQRLVSIDQALDGGAHRGLVEPALQFEGGVDVVGQRAFGIDFRQHPQLALRFAQRGDRAVLRVRPDEAAPAQVGDAVLHRADKPVDIGIRMRGGEEAGAPFPDVDALFEHVIEEQVQVLGEFQTEHRAEPRDLDRRLGLHEERIQRACDLRGPFVERGLQRRAFLFDLLQHGQRGRHRQRVLAERAAERGAVRDRERVVAVGPHAAVDGVHEAGGAGDDAQRQAAADDLAVRREIGPDAEHGLRAARMDAEAGDHFVEDQRDTGLFGDAAQFLEKRDGLQGRVAALHRLHHHGRQGRRHAAYGLERGVAAVVEQDHVLDRAERHAGGDGFRDAFRVRRGERAVGMAVIRMREHHDLVAPGHGAREPHRGHDRLGTGVRERDAIEAGDAGKARGHFADEAGACAQFERALPFAADLMLDEIRRVAEQMHAEAHREIDVLVAVDVPQPRTGRALADDRIQHLLGRKAEADRGPAVGQHRAGRLHRFLRFPGTRRVARDQRFEMLLLYGGQAARPLFDRAAPRHHRLGRPVVGRGRRCRRGLRCGRGGRHRGRGLGRDVRNVRNVRDGLRGDRRRPDVGVAGQRRAQQLHLLAHDARQQLILFQQHALDRGAAFGRHPFRRRGGERRRHLRGRRERHRGRLAHGRDHGLGLGRRGGRRQIVRDILGERLHRRQVFEEATHGQLHAVLFLDVPDGLDQHDRVGAHFQERQVDVDGGGIGLDQFADLAAKPFENLAATVVGRRCSDG